MMEISLGSREYQINPQISGSNNIYTSALQPCLSWSNYQLREEYSCDNSMEEYSSAADFRHSAPAAILCSDVLDNMDLNEADLLLRSSGSVLVLQGTESTSNYNLNAACSNSINNSNSNAVQVVLNNDKMVEKSLADPGTAGILSRARHHDPISSSCASDPHPLVVDSIAADSNYFNVGTTHKFYHMSSNFRAPPRSESFPAESRDHQYCLLSGSDHMSGTDKSAEDDDGISVLFSDGGNKQLLYLSQVGAAASSSGEKSHDNINNAILDVHWSSSSYTTRASEPDDPASSSRAAPAKKPRSEKAEKNLRAAKNISFRQPKSSNSDQEEPDMEAIAQMKEMIYRAAAFRPVNFGVDQEVVLEKPKRKNVRISSDPQTVAARQRRERISQRIRVLQRLVPGGSKMDTASMLDEAANYLKFLKSQVTALEKLGGGHKKLDHSSMNNATSSSLTFSPHQKYFNHTIFPMQNFVPHDHTTRSSKP